MDRLIQRLFFAAAIFWLAAAPAILAAQSVRDDRGREFALAVPAKRIVSLAPHVTELVFAAGAGDALRGATSFSDYPEPAKKIPRVGDAGRIDRERILLLYPDMVIGWQGGNAVSDIDALERRSVPVFLTNPRHLEDIPRLIEAIGALARTEMQAGRAAAQFRAKLTELAERYSRRRPVSVFVEIWHDPLITVNGAHFIDDVIRLCGGRNIFASAPNLMPVISMENLLVADPEVILTSASLDVFRAANLAAVRGSRVFFIHPDILHRPTPRILEGANKMCAQIDTARQPVP